MLKCGSCKHYLGGGDWNLCCDLKYDLCYEYTEACEQYEFAYNCRTCSIPHNKWTGCPKLNGKIPYPTFVCDNWEGKK